jgi:hypothetical protein
MKDFFKQGNPNGLFSWQHLLVCFVALSIMFTLGITLGIRDKKRGVTLHKNKVLMWAAIAIWFGELSKYIVVVVTIGWKGMLSELPLFLCSLQLFHLCA